MVAPPLALPHAFAAFFIHDSLLLHSTHTNSRDTRENTRFIIAHALISKISTIVWTVPMLITRDAYFIRTLFATTERRESYICMKLQSAQHLKITRSTSRFIHLGGTNLFC